MATAIECKELVKTYDGNPPVEAVRGIDLSIASGECFGVLGPNGAGKTTTIEILEGILSPTSGDVVVLGQHWSEHATEIRQKIGVSLQETRLSEKQTVTETLRLFASFYRNSLPLLEIMQMVSLEEKANTWVKKLSGGQRQRLAVATALIGNPDLLFLDEPTTGLDPTSRRQLWDIIRDFKRNGRTVLLTTHYMEEAEQLCDRVAIVDQGKIIALGSPADLIQGVGGENMIEFSIKETDQLIHEHADTESIVNDWQSLPGVNQITHVNGSICLAVTEPHVVIPALLEKLKKLEVKLASLTTRSASLEDVFVTLTGRHLEQTQEEAK